MLEFKVSWYISDHTVAGHGMTLVVPASSFHRLEFILGGGVGLI